MFIDALLAGLLLENSKQQKLLPVGLTPTNESDSRVSVEG